MLDPALNAPLPALPTPSPQSGLDAEALFGPAADSPPSIQPGAGAAPSSPRSESESEQFARAREHAAAQRHKEAAEILQPLLAGRPNDQEARQLLLLSTARMAKIERRVGAAFEAYKAVLELDESNQEAANEVRWLSEEAARRQELLEKMKKSK